MCRKLGFAILLFISGFNVLLSAPKDITLYNFSTIGFLIAEISSIIFVYALYTDKKDIGFFANIGIILGFLVNIIMLYKIYNNNIEVVLGIGFYLFLLAYLLYFASFFVSDVKEKKRIVETKESELEKKFANKDFIRGKYILGLKNDVPLSNCECLLSVDNNRLQIIIVKDNDTFNYDIDVNTIDDISINKVVLMNQNNSNVEDHTLENNLLMVAFLDRLEV